MFKLLMYKDYVANNISMRELVSSSRYMFQTGVQGCIVFLNELKHGILSTPKHYKWFMHVQNRAERPPNICVHLRSRNRRKQKIKHSYFYLIHSRVHISSRVTRGRINNNNWWLYKIQVIQIIVVIISTTEFTVNRRTKA